MTTKIKEYTIDSVIVDFTQFDFLTKLKIDKIIDFILNRNWELSSKRLMVFEAFSQGCKSKECISYLSRAMREYPQIVKDYSPVMEALEYLWGKNNKCRKVVSRMYGVLYEAVGMPPLTEKQNTILRINFKNISMHTDS